MREITAKSRAGLTSRETVDVARKRVTPGPYLIRRHGLWFRHAAEGYTSNLSEAGVFDSDTARDYLCVEGLSVVPLDSLRQMIETEINKMDRAMAGLTALLEKATAPKPDAEGWIPWGGGECPVSEGTPLVIRYRCGNEYWGAVADKPDADRTHGARGWRHDGGNGDIIAYRVCKPEATE